MDGEAAQSEFQSYDLRKHVEAKGMWAGATQRATIPGLLGAVATAVTDPTTNEETPKLMTCAITQDHTPALLKGFDELLVNASDHAKTCAARSTQRKFSKVTYVRVGFTPERGAFSVENDGPGIPVVRHDDVSAQHGRDIYIPEIAFCILLSGSNMEKAPDSIKGGINGVGAKIANIHSVAFRYETVSYDTDGSRRLYVQKCRNRMLKIEPPTIIDLKKNWPPPASPGQPQTPLPTPTPHTTVQMLPAYAALGYGEVGKKVDGEYTYPGTWGRDYKDILAWLRLRCCQLAAYLGPKVQVTLNGKAIPIMSPADLAGVYLLAHGPDVFKHASFFETKMKGSAEPYKKHPWDVTAVISPNIKSFTHVSIINGVVTSAGSHLAYIKTLLKEGTIKKVKAASKDKDFTTNVGEVCKHMLLVVVGALPGADWTGQRKDELTMPKSVLSHYTFAATWLRQISEVLSSALIEASGKKQKKKPRVKPDKLTPAKLAGARKNGPVASLMVAEGDSALTLIRMGLTLGKANPGGPNFQTHGMFSLGGVPMNAAKKVTAVKTAEVDEDGEANTILVRSKSLQDNKVISALEQILNLSHNCTYETEAERNKLYYKHIIVCVDQDVDGAGKILGILLTYFHLFWPALIRAGFVKWFMTPIIRVYPKSAKTSAQRAKVGPVEEFYHEQEFLSWAASLDGDASDTDGLSKQYAIEYYKGLGSHDDHEVLPMFQNFEERLYTFTLDEASARLFDVYFGVPTAPRKAELSTPLQELSVEEITFLNETRQVSCSLQLRHFAKAYKLDALERQLPGALDSFTVGRRKALAGARQRFGNRAGECKTFQLAGYVADRMSYHHGGASMENTIVRMCQTFPGSRQLPLIIGAGSFGSRVGGGDDAASPRYTKVSLNVALVNALFPKEDDWILPYEFVDGQRAQPQSYAPVIPLTPIDNMEIPSEGWNYKCWGRKISQVAAIVNAFCDPTHEHHRIVRGIIDPHATPAAAPPAAELYAKFCEVFPLDISLRGIGGELRMRKGKLHHFGTYSLRTVAGDEEGMQGAVVVVTELPLRTWSDKFATSLGETARNGKPTAKSAYIQSADDYSSKTQIQVNVVLRPGALALIRQKYGKFGADPIEDFLGLYTSLSSTLNVIRPSAGGGGGVIQLGDDYHRLVLYHLPHRRKYYKLRFERKATVLRLLIRVENEILRYLALAGELKISEIPDEAQACALLARKEFPQVHLTLIKQPKYATLAELDAAIVEASAALSPPPALRAAEHDDEMLQADPDDEQPGAEKEARATYNYILNLRERDLVLKARQKREAKVAKLVAELAEVEKILAEQPFAAASVWREELAKVLAVVQAQGYYS